MPCGCTPVCTKLGDSLDVNIINETLPIEITSPLEVTGVEGAPVDVNIVSPDPITIDGAVTITGTPAVTISGTPAVTISGTPAVTISGTPTVAVSGTVATNAIKGTAVDSVAAPTTTSAQIVAANASRKSLTIYNNGTQTVYLRPQATASAANGMPLAAGSSFVDDASANVWHAVAASGTGDLRILEVS